MTKVAALIVAILVVQQIRFSVTKANNPQPRKCRVFAKYLCSQLVAKLAENGTQRRTSMEC
jgi:hypothetical protein